MAILTGGPSDFDDSLRDPHSRLSQKRESEGHIGGWEDRACVTCHGWCEDRKGAVAGTRCAQCRRWEEMADVARREKRLHLLCCFQCGRTLDEDDCCMLGIHAECRDLLRLRAAQRDDMKLSVRRVGIRRA